MYDVIIIGCGPAGMTAAIYTLRAGKKVLIIEKESIGGQMASSPLIENYPGFSKISGADLANNLYDQVIDLNGEIEIGEVKEIVSQKNKKIVVTDSNKFETKSVIVAVGAKYRLLGLENEINLIGNGIHFCVACDGAFYKDKTVAVIGGGNSALINALALSDICKKVYIIQLLDEFTGEQTLIERLKNKSNIEIITNGSVTKIIGKDSLKSIIINDTKELSLDGMFISIGLIPQTEMFQNIIKTNKYNYIESTVNGETNIEGIFVAGDCRDKKIRQITTAVSDGTIAALNAIEFLKTK